MSTSRTKLEKDRRDLVLAAPTGGAPLRSGGARRQGERPRAGPGHGRWGSRRGGSAGVGPDGPGLAGEHRLGLVDDPPDEVPGRDQSIDGPHTLPGRIDLPGGVDVGCRLGAAEVEDT